MYPQKNLTLKNLTPPKFWVIFGVMGPKIWSGLGVSNPNPFGSN